MGDIMRPIPFEELLTRIFDEYQQQRSIFGIPEQQFYSPVNMRKHGGITTENHGPVRRWHKHMCRRRD